MTEDLKLIVTRLTPLFTRRYKTRYWLTVVNNHYTHTYNFFFNSQPKNERQRSIPLHSLANYDLAQLEQFLKQLRQYTQLTIEYIGFEGLRWPESWHLIQRTPRADE